MLQSTAVGLATLLLLPAAAAAQSFDAIGTRAAGMGGASVAVSDDATAVYSNPGGFAAGSYFSVVADGRKTTVDPDGSPRAGDRSGYFAALGTPALAISYYRLRTTVLDAGGQAEGQLRADTLVTHNTGVTFVQNIAPGLAVGTTFRFVHGVASTGIAVDGNRSDLFDSAVDLDGKSTNRGDADVGVMARFGGFKAGVTVRNLSEPTFATPEPGRELRLVRQARAGVSLTPARAVILAADMDITENDGPLGEERVLAFGAEALIVPGVIARGGLHLNTAGGPAGDTPSYAVGGSYLIKRLVLVDAQITFGSDKTEHGWGIAARFVY